MEKYFLSHQGRCGHVYPVPVDPMTLVPAADPNSCPHCLDADAVTVTSARSRELVAA